MDAGASGTGRLENTHGLSQSNHKSCFIVNFSFFDVLTFGGSPFAERGGGVSQARQRALSPTSSTSNSEAPSTRGSRRLVWTALYEQPSCDSTVHVRQHSGQCP